MSTPMHPTTSLGLDKESNSVNITEYRQMRGISHPNYCVIQTRNLH